MNFDVEATHVFPIALFRTFLDGISDELGLEKIVRANTLEKKNLTGIWAFSDSIYGESAIQTHPNLHQLKELEPLNNLIVDVIYGVMFSPRDACFIDILTTITFLVGFCM